MKVERLLAIVLLLINRKRVQAKELAEMFEVSLRTIYRDIDTINQAGIPVVTFQGAGGGIGIMESYRLERNLFAEEDMIMILSILHGVNKELDDGTIERTIKKVEGLLPSSYEEKRKPLVVDFSGWGNHHYAKEKISIIKKVIDNCQVIRLTYASAENNESIREIEPVQMHFRSSNWYAFGFCRLRQEYRLFKLSRVRKMEVLEENFPQHMVVPSLEDYEWKGSRITVTLLFPHSSRAKVEDFFLDEDVWFEQDGIYVTITYPEDEWLYGFILSFGSGVEVIDPPRIREKIKERAKEIYLRYTQET
jgi:predicted DNA-binding transcriptional regulator YafY